MSKVITFSRLFPAYHSRNGEQTFFVEKILNWFWDQPENEYHNVTDMIFDLNGDKMAYYQAEEFNQEFNNDIRSSKVHTIRSGKRFKVGDKFSPRVWSGKPYQSKQITIAPDIEIKKVWDIEILPTNEILLGNIKCCFGSEYAAILAAHDGLSPRDFQNWFSKLPFSGQIICWNESINY